jgi:hypothetical protein
MVNALKLMETANHKFVPVGDDEMDIDPKLFIDIATRCGFTVIKREEANKLFLKLRKRTIPVARLYSREENSKFNFLDIADLHVGHPQFDEEKLIQTFEMAKERGVQQVFIAGDLFELDFDPREYDPRIMNEQKQKRIKRQFKECLRHLANILSQYPFSYYAINGNHEYVLEQLGIMHPLKELETTLKKKSINFNAYDTYLMDFEIAGVIKRVIHLERYYQCKNVFSAMERLLEFKRHGGLFTTVDGATLPIRFLECGHVHMTMELYNADHQVFISQPGCFLKDENNYRPGIFAEGEITPELHVIRY